MKPGLAALCPALGPTQESPIPGMVGPSPNPTCVPGPAAFQSTLAECIGTFVFVSVVLAVKFGGGGGPAPMGCSVVAGGLYGALSISAPVSGGAINPAVGIAQTIVQSVVDDATKAEG